MSHVSLNYRPGLLSVSPNRLLFVHFVLLVCFVSTLLAFLYLTFFLHRFEIRNGNNLRLFRVKEQDEGMYTCTSENSVGKTEASAMLQVHGEKCDMHIQ